MMLVAASWEEQLQEQSPLKLSASCFDVVFANAMLENESEISNLKDKFHRLK